MNSVINKKGVPVSYLYNKIILDKNTLKPLAIILGSSLINAAGKICGKVFKNKIRKIDGKILAAVNLNNESETQVNDKHVFNWAIQILDKLDNNEERHYVEDSDEWADETLQEALLQQCVY